MTLFMNIPWVILHFPLYETSKQLLAPPQQRNEGPAAQIAAGGIAGGVAAALVSSAEQPRSQIMQDATCPYSIALGGGYVECKYPQTSIYGCHAHACQDTATRWAIQMGGLQGA